MASAPLRAVEIDLQSEAVVRYPDAGLGNRDLVVEVHIAIHVAYDNLSRLHAVGEDVLHDLWRGPAELRIDMHRQRQASFFLRDASSVEDLPFLVVHRLAGPDLADH